MRIYKNCKEAVSETKRELKEMGVEVHLKTMQDKVIKDDPDYYTNELIGYSYMITNPSDKDELLKSFGKDIPVNITYCECEFDERIGGKPLNPGTAYKLRKDTWKEFMHNGVFSYTYSERMAGQVDIVIDTLMQNQHARNAIISIWDREIDCDRMGGVARVPCSMYYQILIRDGKVNMIYNIRSNDLMTHWCYDIWLAVRLQEYIAEKLDFPVGWFMQQVGSLHAYHKDLKGIF